MRNVLQLCLFLSVLVLAGCSDSDEDGVRITGPEVSEGSGRVYPINEITFLSNDGVPISALFGASASAERLPTVVLLHDLGGDKQDCWFLTIGTHCRMGRKIYPSGQHWPDVQYKPATHDHHQHHISTRQFYCFGESHHAA